MFSLAIDATPVPTLMISQIMTQVACYGIRGYIRSGRAHRRSGVCSSGVCSTRSLRPPVGVSSLSRGIEPVYCASHLLRPVKAASAGLLVRGLNLHESVKQGVSLVDFQNRFCAHRFALSGMLLCTSDAPDSRDQSCPCSTTSSVGVHIICICADIICSSSYCANPSARAVANTSSANTSLILNLGVQPKSFRLREPTQRHVVLFAQLGASSESAGTLRRSVLAISW
jgi:hypothetical protein